MATLHRARKQCQPDLEKRARHDVLDPARPAVSTPDQEGILTLEPLIEAIREGLEDAGWELSGLQKTTSHQFEGRWDGESTRSAYLFFHWPSSPEPVSIDVYLDETSRGLTGNIALVADLVALGELGEPGEALRILGALSSAALPRHLKTPLTLRLRLKDGTEDPAVAETEVRFKLRLPEEVLAEGPASVRLLTARTVDAFEGVISSAELARYLSRE
jgi:hypothetical protein